MADLCEGYLAKWEKMTTFAPIMEEVYLRLRGFIKHFFRCIDYIY